MAQTAMQKFEHTMREFWLGEYDDHVDTLNRMLAKGTDGEAGFVKTPPSVLTGDPFSLIPGNCLLVLGLNPKWQGDDARFQDDDIRPAESAWKARSFDDYRRHRANYFRPGSTTYYGRYFTRLGNALASGFYGMPQPVKEKAAMSMSFLDRRVAKLDLLPWWSYDTSKIKWRPYHVPTPLAAWVSVIRAAMEALRPSAVVVNGSGWDEMIHEVFGCQLTTFRYHDPKGGSKQARFGHVGETLLLSHPQLHTARGWAPSHEGYVAMTRKAKNLASGPRLPRRNG